LPACRQTAAGTQLNSDEYAALEAALAAGNLTNAGLAYEEYTVTNPPLLNIRPPLRVL
jgi:hypothetical protein